MPAEPCPADYATDADYTVAMQIYEQQKKAAEEKTADLLAKHDAGAIRIFVKTSRDNARLVYVNQVTKGRESTGELIARLEEKKIRNTELAHEKPSKPSGRSSATRRSLRRRLPSWKTTFSITSCSEACGANTSPPWDFPKRII